MSMQILEISADYPLWDQVWRLYTESFPDFERRDEQTHRRAMGDERFHNAVAVGDGKVIGILFYWAQDDLVYAEHLAVDPAVRGQGAGTQFVQWLQEQSRGKTLILDIEPPVDEVTRRRLRFYERHGFVALTDLPMWHYTYTEGGQKHPFVLVSWPVAPSPATLERFGRFVHDSVLRYLNKK